MDHEEIRRHMTTLVIKIKEKDRQPEKKAGPKNRMNLRGRAEET